LPPPTRATGRGIVQIGDNKAYQYSLTGTLLKTISLSNCTGYCDGLEYLNTGGGELISNRRDGYNVYDFSDVNGNLLKSAFFHWPCRKYYRHRIRWFELLFGRGA
jgi:hypothetical protein